MRCLICNSTDKWKNVDEYRIKPAGMAICTQCSFVSYPDRWKSKEEIIAHYRKDYRQPPTAGNFYAGQRKIHFHSHFLNDTIQEWHRQKKTAPVVFESGAAYGLVLSWFKQLFPLADVSGSELTTSYRRVAKHELGIDLQEDIDTSKKYDMIMSYKVLEHQLDADKELAVFHSCLKDDGLLYVSVPIWFGVMNNFGAQGFDLEYYYDPNHINVWQKEHFEFLLKKSGFEIIKADHIMYDSTYLCKKTTPKPDMVYAVPPNETIEKLRNIKDAAMAFLDGDMPRAIAAWPNFPLVYVARMEAMRKECFDKGWEWTKANVLDVAFKNCPESTEPYLIAADMALRLGQIEESIGYAKEALARRPGQPQSFIQLINCFRELGVRATDQAQKTHYFSEAKKLSVHLGAISAQHAKEAIDFTYLYAAQIPLENEN
jgi:SAM-dependent methyltransferase